MDVPNKFILNVMAIVTKTLAHNGAIATNVVHRLFLFNRVLMLTEESALPNVHRFLEAMRLPMADSVVKKVVELAVRISEEGCKFYTHGTGYPFLTMFVTVEHGEVTEVMAEHDYVDDDDEDYDEDEEDDEKKDEHKADDDGKKADDEDDEDDEKKDEHKADDDGKKADDEDDEKKDEHKADDDGKKADDDDKNEVNDQLEALVI